MLKLHSFWNGGSIALQRPIAPDGGSGAEHVGKYCNFFHQEILHA